MTTAARSQLAGLDHLRRIAAAQSATVPFPAVRDGDQLAVLADDIERAGKDPASLEGATRHMRRMR